MKSWAVQQWWQASVPVLAHPDTSRRTAMLCVLRQSLMASSTTLCPVPALLLLLLHTLLLQVHSWEEHSTMPQQVALLAVRPPGRLHCEQTLQDVHQYVSVPLAAARMPSTRWQQQSQLPSWHAESSIWQEPSMAFPTLRPRMVFCQGDACLRSVTF